MARKRNVRKHPVGPLKVVGRIVRERAKQPGTPPGTLVHSGPQRVEVPRITLVDFDDAAIREREVWSTNELTGLPSAGQVRWVNMDGLHDVELVQQWGDAFGIHPLVLEDILRYQGERVGWPCLRASQPGVPQELRLAVERRERLEIRYLAHDGRSTVRHVDAVSLELASDAAYLVGFCHLRSEQRTFRLDRIVSWRVVVPG